ncbi:MBL fold metallo-hydrolase [Candidatus Aerophobetes bacterium]|nr:MBL fold metallo-hydrolase [Candidatus Aerophobetes bacterium]
MSLQFLGAANNVTGSSYLLDVDETRILVDCGLYQEREFKHRNWEPFPVDAKSIQFVLLTHAHLDHCGLLPKLVREGFEGKIICTSATKKIAQIVLVDAARIQEEDAKLKKERHQREGRKGPYPELPLYTQQDAEAVFSLFETVEYETELKLNRSVKTIFYDAGHILGSAMVKVNASSDNEQRAIVFSGDVGRCDKPIVRDPTFIRQADYILVESTYGDRALEGSLDTKEKLADTVNSTERKGGNIVIPSFAIERTQELLYVLNELLIEDRISHLMTFVDSPMAINVIDVFKQHPEYFDEDMLQHIESESSPFYFKNLKLTRTTSESKAINHLRGSCIIIAGSGMCTGGRIKHHLIHNISRPESSILFVGYQAKETLGRQIVGGAKEVRIHGSMRTVKAEVSQINGFSAHADKNELLKWLAGFELPPRKLFVVHGEDNATSEFARLVRENYGWNVAIPEYKSKAILD